MVVDPAARAEDPNVPADAGVQSSRLAVPSADVRKSKPPRPGAAAAQHAEPEADRSPNPGRRQRAPATVRGIPGQLRSRDHCWYCPQGRTQLSARAAPGGAGAASGREQRRRFPAGEGDKTDLRRDVGCMLRHPGHKHWHYDAMARYSLRLPGSDKPP